MHRYGIESVLLVVNQIEALVAIGEWDEAERLSAAALRGDHLELPARAHVHTRRGRDRPRRIRRRPGAPRRRGRRPVASTSCSACTTPASPSSRSGSAAGRTPQAAIDAGLARARRHEAAQIRLQLCAKGLRAHAELAALARARRDADAVRHWLSRARNLLTAARRAAAEASAITPNADGWLALAEAEYQRVRGVPGPELWSDAAETWDRLERPPLVAYCRWRQAEALVAAGASRTEAIVPLREAFTRRRSDRGEAVVARTRTARPTRPARSRRASRAARRTADPGGDPRSHRARGRGPRTSSRAATPTARSPRHSSSAPRRRASTSRTSCTSSACRTGKKPPPSRTASRHHRRATPTRSLSERCRTDGDPVSRGSAADRDSQTAETRRPCDASNDAQDTRGRQASTPIWAGPSPAMSALRARCSGARPGSRHLDDAFHPARFPATTDDRVLLHLLTCLN